MTDAVKTNPLYHYSIPKLILKFSLPSVISLLVNSLYNIIDQVFIGQDMGYIGNAATSVSFPLLTITFAFSFLIGNGAAAFMSLHLGKGDKKSAEKGTGNAITMLVVVGFVFMGLGLLLESVLLDLFGATPEIKPYALSYIHIMILGFPCNIVAMGLNPIIRADGRPVFSMLSMLIGAVTNVILDYLFIFVFHWGIEGAAFATIIGQILSCIFSVAYVFHFKSVKMSKDCFKMDWKIFLKVISLGTSSCITQLAIALVAITFNNSLKYYGALSVYGSEIPLSAFGIVMKVNQILISITVGIAIGTQPILGFNYGAKNYKRVKKTLYYSIGLSAIFTTIGFVMFVFFPQTIINLFGQEEALYNEFAQKCFRIFLFFCILNGVQIVSGIFFQAIGKPVSSAFLSLLRQVILLIPLVLILPLFFGVEGCLFAGPVADLIAFVITLIMITKEMRRLDKMQLELAQN